EVRSILLVFAADVIEHVAVGHERERRLDVERPRVVLRIVEGQLQIDVSKVAAVVALGDAHLVASRMAEGIERGPGVNADGFDDERIALPGADGVPRPTRFGIARKAAAVGVNLSRWIAGPGDHDDFAGRVNHLEPQDEQVDRKPARQTGGALGFLALSLAKRGGALRRERLVAWFHAPERVADVLVDVIETDL